MKGSVYRRGVTWTAHVSWQKGGRQQQSKKGGFRTKKEAEAALVELVSAVQGGRHVPAGRRAFGDYLTGWLDSLAVAGLRESTVHSYRRLVDKWILPELGHIGLDELTAVDLDGLYATMAAAGLKPRTVRFAHSVCHKALADAARKKVVQLNVAAQASPPKSSACRAPEAAVWTPAEMKTFLELTADHHLGALFRLAAMTGLRRGELCGLRWVDVDLDGHTLAVRQSITAVKSRPVLGDVKTGTSRRVVDLDPRTVAVLRKHSGAQKEMQLLVGPGWTDTGLVFTMADGRGSHPDSVGQAFQRLVDASELPRITLHGLRHSHTTHLLASGMNPKLVSSRLGHASVAFTLDRYGHEMPGQQQAAAAAVAALVDGP